MARISERRICELFAAKDEENYISGERECDGERRVESSCWMGVSSLRERYFRGLSAPRSYHQGESCHRSGTKSLKKKAVRPSEAKKEFNMLEGVENDEQVREDFEQEMRGSEMKRNRR